MNLLLVHVKPCVQWMKLECTVNKLESNVDFQIYSNFRSKIFCCRRWKENLLHYYEIRPQVAGGRRIPDEPKVVKEFRRSAADTRHPKPHELRTSNALKHTVEYLLSDIVNDNRRPFNFAYDFIFDRLRAVRQEIVIQNVSESLTIELLEPVIMFLAYSLYR